VDHQVDAIELQLNDLEKVGCRVRADGEHLWWIGVRVEVDDRDCVANGVHDRRFVMTVFGADRSNSTSE